MTTSIRSFAFLSIICGSTLVFSSCGTETRQQNQQEVEASAETSKYSQIFEPIPAEAEAPADNPMTEEKVDLGHMLFFENRLSRSGIISCNSCHVVGAAGVDHRD